MKFILDLTAAPGTDPMQLADWMLDWLCSTDDDDMPTAIESFDSVDPVRE